MENSRKEDCPYKNWKDGDLPPRDVFGADCCNCQQKCDEFMKWFSGPKGR
jgi:hypothetical protein